MTLQRLWRFPFRALPRGAGRLLRGLGMPVSADAAAFMRRSRAAAAHRHAELVLQLDAELSRARGLDGALASLATGSPAHVAEQWASPAFSDTLIRALAEDERDQARPPEARGRRMRHRRGRPMSRSDPLHGEVSWESLVSQCFSERLGRWVALTRWPVGHLCSAAERVLRALRGCAPCFTIALLRIWTDSLPTSARRGKDILACPICARPTADKVGHLVTCRRAWNLVSRATGVGAPTDTADAIGLRPCPVVSGRIRRGFCPPPERVFAVAVLVDSAAKARDALTAGRSAASCREVFTAASRNANRRLRPLAGRQG